jgi:hypothetical protein
MGKTPHLKGATTAVNEVCHPREWAVDPIVGHATAVENASMPAAFITCATPRSMTPEHAAGWLERRAELLSDDEAVAEVSVRELRPRGGDPIWLMRVAARPEETDAWELLVHELVADLDRLGMRPTAVIDERAREVAGARREVQPAA